MKTPHPLPTGEAPLSGPWELEVELGLGLGVPKPGLCKGPRGQGPGVWESPGFLSHAWT